MNAPSVIVSQHCNCGRTGEHLHYSSNHDFFIRFALIFFLVVEGLAFVKGAVEGSTLLLLYKEERLAYGLVSAFVRELVAPYEYLTVVIAIVELIALTLTVAAVFTLHSLRERKTHEVTTVGAALLLSSGIAVNLLHSFLVDRALLQLPSRVCQWTPQCSQVLELARHAEGRFVAEYGFWGPPSEVVILVFSVACLAFLLAAALATKAVSVWQPTPTPVAPTPPIPEPVRPTAEIPAVVLPTTVMPVMPTKSCRFCGAKIPRVSKYCEECGNNLG